MDHPAPRRRLPAWLRLGWHGRMPAWQRSLTTFLFAVVVAVGFTLVGHPMTETRPGALLDPGAWWRWFQISLLISLSIGFMIQALFEAAYRLIGPARMQAMTGWKRGALHGAVSMLGVAAGVPLGRWLASGVAPAGAIPASTGTLLSSLVIAALITGVMMMFFASNHERIESERRATEAQLKLLQGQIEPHFLFNTLANVIGLMEHDAPRAKLMLESFVDYLRSTLGSLRHEAHTLGDELALVEAYLNIVQIRMDDRLAYAIDVPDELHAAALPALTLQPLVENAIHHGLEPKIEGGHVLIRARRVAGRLVVTVQDDGLGLRAAPAARGSGTAILNIRERLQQLHGDAARLDVETASTGTISKLTLP